MLIYCLETFLFQIHTKEHGVTPVDTISNKTTASDKRRARHRAEIYAINAYMRFQEQAKFEEVKKQFENNPLMEADNAYVDSSGDSINEDGIIDSEPRHIRGSASRGDASGYHCKKNSSSAGIATRSLGNVSVKKPNAKRSFGGV
jgi:hypothetical protein